MRETGIQIRFRFRILHSLEGEPFVIAKAGKPLVRVAAIDAPAEPKRLGFLAGEIEVPDDFDTLAAAEIAFGFETYARASFRSLRDR
ncbi:MAG: type II toxin-antitoxin system Phd/YefM family antitoxin [Gemmatimonadota bacterium]